MPPYLDPYRSQESVRPVDPNNIVLPEIVDGGGTFHQLGRTLLREAEPHLREKAERQALEDAGRASIVKDPETGQFVRANLTQGGGMVYAQAYARALDVRHAGLIIRDYEKDLNELYVQFRHDPTGYAAAAEGIAEAILEAAPPTIRGHLEDSLSREMLERTRGLSQKVQEEQHRGVRNGLLSQNHGMYEQIRQLESTRLHGVNDDDVDAAQTEVRNRIDANVRLLLDMGVTQEELLADEMQFEAQMLVPETRARNMEALRTSAKMLASFDSIESLDILIDTWGKGVESPHDFDGLTYKSVVETLGPFGMDQFVGAARAKRQKLAEEQSRAADEKPLTLADYDKMVGLSGTGVPVDPEAYTRASFEFVQTHGFPDEAVQTSPGRDALVGFFRRHGFAPRATDKAVVNLANAGRVSEAVALVNAIRTSPPYQGSNRGDIFFQSLPNDIQSTVIWASTVGQHYDPKLLDQVWAEKIRNRVPSISDLPGMFAGATDGKRPLGYHEVKARHLLKLMPGADPETLNMFNNVLGREFDEVLAFNMALYDRPSVAMQATAQQFRDKFDRSPYFYGGWGDARVFKHNSINAQTLNQLFESDPRYARVLEYARWGEMVEGTNRPRIQLQRIETENWSDSLGAYRLTVFDKRGQALKNFRIDMDYVLSGYEQLSKRIVEQKRQEALRNAPAGPRWVLGKLPSGKQGMVESQRWKDEQARKRASGAKNKIQKLKQEATTVSGRKI